MNNNEDNYQLIPYLAADLRRARFLTHGIIDNIPRYKLWFGIFSPRFIPVLLYRLAFHFDYLGCSFFAKFFSLINFFFFGIEIATKCKIGKGIFFPHTQGTVIGAFSIGECVIIFQGVTLGARELNFSFDHKSRPVIEDNVTIGAGAKVLGGVNLGVGCSIGANAVVLNDVESGSVMVGIPAKKIIKSEPNEL